MLHVDSMVAVSLREEDVLALDSSRLSSADAFKTFVKGIELDEDFLLNDRWFTPNHAGKEPLNVYDTIMLEMFPTIYNPVYLDSIGGQFSLRLSGQAEYTILSLNQRVIVLTGLPKDMETGKEVLDLEIPADIFIAYARGLMLDISETALADDDELEDRVISAEELQFNGMPSGKGPENRVIVYKNNYYGGERRFIDADAPYLGYFNDNISSIKVPTGYYAEVFEHSNFKGASTKFSGDVSSFNSAGFDNKTSSIKIHKGYLWGNGYVVRPDDLIVYTGKNFTGSSRILFSVGDFGYGNLFNDSISSIIVPDGFYLEVFKNSGYSGPSAKVSGKISVLDITIDNEISSLKMHKGYLLPNGVVFNDKVMVFRHKDFQGSSITIADDTSWVGTYMNDKISSIAVPEGYYVEVFSNADYQGSSAYYQGFVSNLAGGSFNDEITSLKIHRGFILPNGRPASHVVTVFKDANFNGKDIFIESNISDLSTIGNWDEFNDSISSIAVGDGYYIQAFEDKDFQGAYIYLAGGATSLGTGANDKISSIRVFKGKLGNDGEPKDKLTVYADANYEGLNYAIKSHSGFVDHHSLAHNISSLRVASGYYIEVWLDDGYFKGKSSYLSGDVSFLGASNDKISSIRLHKGGLANGKPLSQYSLIELFENSNYKGKSITVGNEVSNLADLQFDNTISSIIVPKNYYIEVFDQAGFKGESFFIAGGASRLNEGANDRISSFKIHYGVLKPNGQPEVKITLWGHGNYQGPTLEFGEDLATIGGGLAGDISSLKVPHGFYIEAFTASNFKGTPLYFSGSVNFLGDGNDKIASIKIHRGELHVLAHGRPLAHTTEVTVFTDSDFEGGYREILTDTSTLGNEFDEKISSIIVPKGYYIEAFEHAGFKGASVYLAGGISKLGTGANDRISSFKIHKGQLLADNTPANKVSLFSNSKFGGKSLIIGLDTDTLDQGDLAHNISSLKVAEGYYIEGFADKNYQGASQYFSGDVSFVGGKLNDTISSIKIHKGVLLSNGIPLSQVTKVTVFKDSNYLGGSRTVLDSASDLGDQFNDAISSLVVPKGYYIEVFEQAGFKGPSAYLAGQISHLGEGTDNRISSIKIHKGKLLADGSPENKVSLFSNSKFQGKSLEVTADNASLDNSNLAHNVSSLKVVKGYYIEAFAGKNYQGASQYFSGDVSFVGGELNDTISSIKLHKGVLLSSGKPLSDKVKVFKDSGYLGESTELLVNTPNLGDEFDNTITSITVPEGYYIEVFQQAGFKGASFYVTGQVSKLEGGDNKISSIKVHKGKLLADGSPENKVYLFENVGFEGKSLSVTADNASFDNSSLANTITSLKVATGYYIEAFADKNYQGASQYFSGDAHYIGDKINNKISSIKVHKGVLTSAGKPLDKITKVTVFNDSDYLGASREILGDLSYVGNEFNDAITSIVVPEGYYIEAFQHGKFKGGSVYLDGNISQLGQGADNKISSFKLFKGKLLADGSPENKVYLFENTNFEGKSLAVTADDKSFDNSSLAHTITSLKVEKGYYIEAFAGKDFQGASQYFSGDVSFVGDNLNNIISSIKLHKGVLLPNGKPLSNKVTVYKDSGYLGKSTELLSNTSNLGDEFDNSISSITVPEGYYIEAFEQAGFKGASFYITGQISKLGEGSDNRISSIKIHKGKLLADGSPENKVSLFENVGFEGKSLEVTADNTSFDSSSLANTITSLKVATGYYIEAFADKNYQGASQYFSGDVHYIGDKINNKISSIKVHKGVLTSTGKPLNKITKVTVFNDLDYLGESREILGDLAYVGDGFNDAISSIIVPKGYYVEAFEHGNFNGESVYLAGTISRLGTGTDNKISSFKLIKGNLLADGSPENKVYLFENSNFGGESLAVTADNPSFDNSSLAHTITSLKVEKGYYIEAFAGKNFQGASQYLSGDVSFVGDKLNNIISSIKLHKGELLSNGKPLTNEVIVFENSDYNGKSREILADASNLGDQFDDNISSIIVPKGYYIEAFEFAGFKGASAYLSGKISTLGSGSNNKISSIKIHKGELQPNGTPIIKVTLFQNNNYKGKSLEITGDTTNIGNSLADNISAVKVPKGYYIEVFKASNFQGESRFFSGNISSVGNKFNDQIASIKLHKGELQADGTPAPKVIIFEHLHYQGRSLEITSDNAAIGNALDNEVSSVKVPKGYYIEAFTGNDFKGDSTFLSGEVSFVGNGYNNKISSIKLRKGDLQADGTPVPVIRAFKGANFKGESLTFGGSTQWVGWSFNDNISSLIVPNGYYMEAYDEISYKGKPIFLSGEVSNLGALDNKITSLKLRKGTLLPDGTPAPVLPKVMIFDGTNYQGKSLEITGDNAVIGKEFNSEVFSIKVPDGYYVEAFTGDDFQGELFFLSGDISLIGNKYHNKISSIKLHEGTLQADGTPTPAAPIIRVFKDSNYNGKFLNISESTAFVGAEFNDNISSLIVPDGYYIEAFQHGKFKGESVFLSGEVSNLSTFNNEISSIKLHKGFLQADGTPEPKVIIFEKSSYQGKSLGFNRDAAYFGNDLDNTLSSIKVPKGYYVEAFAGNNFQGSSVYLSGDVTFVGDNSDNKISSIKVHKGLLQADGTPLPIITMFKGLNYKGNSLDFSESASWVGWSFNDSISSLIVPDGYYIEAFEDSNFKGKSVFLSGEVSDIGTIDNKITSFRVHKGLLQADGTPAPRVMIFEKSSYQGKYSGFSSDTAYFGDNLRNTISSMKVPEGYYVEAFTGANFAGDSVFLSGDVTFVGDKYDNKISSIKLHKGDLQADGTPVPPAPIITMFKDSNFKGESLNYSGSTEFVGWNFNDRISSLKVPDGYYLAAYDDISYKGIPIFLSGEVSNLGALDNKITSIKLYKGSLQADGTRTPEVILFENPSYEGKSLRIKTDVAHLGNDFNDAISSIKVPKGYYIEAFHDSNFRGSSVYLSGDITFDGDKKDNKISSIKVRKGALQGNGIPEPIITIFQDKDYKGKSKEYYHGDVKALEGEFDGTVSSIKIPDGYYIQAFINKSFKADSVFLSGYVSLAGNKFDNKITSFKVFKGTLLADGTPAARATIFKGSSYEGSSFGFSRDISDLGDDFNNSLSSIKVPKGYYVEAFTEKNFEGSSVFLSKDITFVGDKYNNKISSVKLRKGTLQADGTPTPPVPIIKIFKDSNYKGKSLDFSGDSAYVGNDFNDSISSLIVPDGYYLEAFEHGKFKGKSTLLAGKVSSLSAFDNKISSIKIHKGTLRADGTLTPQVILFEKSSYEGKTLGISGNTAYFGNNLDDTLSSIKVPEGYYIEAFHDSNFRGDSVLLSGDIAFVGDKNDNKISSIKVFKGTLQADGTPTPAVPVIRIFKDSNHEGKSLDFSGDTAYVGNDFNDRISSIIVPDGYYIEAFEHGKFKGESILLSGKVSSLSTFDNKISSIKVHKGLLQDDGTPAPKVTIFQDAKYQGKSLEIDNEAAYLGTDFNNNISSIKVPEGYYIEAFKDNNFEGESVFLAGDVAGIVAGADNKISSIKLHKGVLKNNGTPRVDKVTVFADINYRGASQDINGDSAFLVEALNNNVSSVKIPDGYYLEAFESAGFKGKSAYLSGEVSSLSATTDNLISSVKLHKGELQAGKPVVDIQIFEHGGYSGKSMGITGDTAFLGKSFDKELSSIKVPKGYYIEAFRESNFEGSSTMFAGDVSFVGDKNDNRISSIKLHKGELKSNGKPKVDKIQLFESANFSGKSKAFYGDLKNLGKNFNDKISSLKVPDGYYAEVFQEAKFKGDSVFLSGDIAQLGSKNNDTISSIKLHKGELWSNGQPAVAKIEVFGAKSYAGKSFELTGDSASIGSFADNVTSVKVPEGYLLEAFQHEDFEGGSAFLAGDVSFVGKALEGKISSFKVHKVDVSSESSESSETTAAPAFGRGANVSSCGANASSEFTAGANVSTCGAAASTGFTAGANVSASGVAGTVGFLTGASVSVCGAAATVGFIAGANVSACGVAAFTGFACGANISASGLSVGVGFLCGANLSGCGAAHTTGFWCGGNASVCGVASTSGFSCGANASACGVAGAATGLCGTNASACGTAFSVGSFALFNASACGVNINACNINASLCGINASATFVNAIACGINLVQGFDIGFCILNVFPGLPSC